MKHKSLLTAIFGGLLLLSMAISAKSVYVIADINSSPTPIQAYDIQPAPIFLVYQATHNVPQHGWGAVGLAIDTDSEFLFTTYEQSNTIEIIDARTMTSAGNVSAPGASNLAGIVVDQDNDLVYTVDRNTNKLYIYIWDSVAKTLNLDHIEYLGGVSQAHGVALDEINDLLYVTDLTTTVKIFHTGTWTSAGSFSISQPAQGIAVDVTNGFVYTGNAYPPYGSLHLISKYDLNTNTESTHFIGNNDNVVGLAVDPADGLLYITTGNQGVGGTDQLRVYDSNLNMLYATGDIGNPTGVVVPGREIGFNPLNLAKDDQVGQGQCVPVGGQINYAISYDNLLNTYPVTNVTITDQLPAELDFVSASGGGVYNPGPHTVTWSIGTLPAGDPGATVSLTASINTSATPGGTVTNVCRIASTETSESSVSEVTDVCSQSIDTTPPTCQLSLFDPGPPVAAEFTMNDAESGIASIEVTSLSNATVEIPKGSGNFYNHGDVVTFSPPIATVVVRAEKINQSQGASILLTTTDDSSNAVVCDPVYQQLSGNIPEGFALKQNYPNPFNPSTTIHFDVGLSNTPNNVTLRVYDISGQLIATLVDEPMQPGSYSVSWDGRNDNGQAVAGGVYFLTMRSGSFTATRKMTLLK